MKCPNLLLDMVVLRYCTVNESYCPSDFQYKEYCSTVLYKMCPFYLGYQMRHGERRDDAENKLD